MPYRAIIAVAKAWGRINLVLLRVVAGIDYEIRGREKIPAGPAHRRRQAPVGLGNIRADSAVRQSAVHRQTRIAVDPDLRLADDQGPHGAGRSQRRLAGAHRHDGTRANRTAPTAASSSSSRKARGGRPAPSRATNSAWRIFMPRPACLAADRAQFRPVLAAPLDPAGCRERCWWRFSIRSRPGSTRRHFSSACRATIETATARLIAEAKQRLND